MEMSLPLLALEHLELLELLLLLPLCLAFGGVGGLLFLPPVSSSSSSSSQESLTQDPPLSQELFHPPLSQELLHPLSQEFSHSHESSLCQESSSLSQESCVGWSCCRCSLWSFLMLEVVPFPFFLPALFLPSPFARCCLFFSTSSWENWWTMFCQATILPLVPRVGAAPVELEFPTSLLQRVAATLFQRYCLVEKSELKKKTSLRQTKAAEQATLQKLHAETKPKKHEVTAPKRV